MKSDTDKNRAWLPHLVIALAVGGVVFLATGVPEVYKRLAQEDAWIEWLTVGMFFAAGALFLLTAKRHGFFGGWIVTATGLFCVAVAGEEISWGQRLFSFVPPEVFLDSNYQQELNVHNFAHDLFKPKWLVVAVLAVWGVVLPVVDRLHRAHDPFPLPKHLGKTLLPLSYLPWSLVGIGFLVSYPAEFTSEYVELLTGVLFYLAAFSSISPTFPKRLAVALPFLIMLLGYGWIEAQARIGGDEKAACAQREVKALTDAMARDGALPRLFEKSSVHKRLFTAVESRYVAPSVVQVLQPIACTGVSQNPNRQKYFIDPWGQPYWMQYRSDDEAATLAIYSFGPNRRRDSAEQGFVGPDDIGVQTPMKIPEG